jgi:hypothetical protein
MDEYKKQLQQHHLGLAASRHSQYGNFLSDNTGGNAKPRMSTIFGGDSSRTASQLLLKNSMKIECVTEFQNKQECQQWKRVISETASEIDQVLGKTQSDDLPKL